MRALKSIGRIIAMVGSLLGYGIAGFAMLLILENVIATRLRLKVGDVPDWTLWIAPASGFLGGATLAYFAVHNRIAQLSAFVIAIAQIAACVGYLWLHEIDSDNMIGELIMAGLVYWFGVFSAALAIGAACGFAAGMIGGNSRPR